MKCPMCNGSGKCYEQKIRYQEIETNRTDFTLAKCHKCNGTGEVQMTNEEWFVSLPTEEKADKLTDFSFWLVPTLPSEDKREQIRKKLLEWLKEKHE